MKASKEPIAIIGIGCRYPGKANDPDSLWQMLMNRTDAVTEIPQDRWNIDKYYHSDMAALGKSYAKWGGFIEQIDRFDPECFSISPREADLMDPQQRLLLEVAWQALEDSGHQVEKLSGSNTGVFIGLSTNDYAQIQTDLNDPQRVDPHSATGSAFSIAANRISYCLNFHGPSFVVDTACSSSLVATHLACKSLLADECDIALAGGVNLILLPTPYISFCAATMLSPDGRCKAFDARANGFVRGEGAGMIALKRLSAALADRDPIYAVINATGINQDGRTNGISLPDKATQRALIESVYQQAEIDPGQVFYVEAHGTGTAVGDPIEAGALGEAFGNHRTADESCYMGSIKTNIGHLEAGAGMAGLIKAALCLKHRAIPPNLHFETPNPNIPFEDLKLRVPVAPITYPETNAREMIVGVNSFGFGGTNAHAVLSEFRGNANPSATESQQQRTDCTYLLPLSARSEEGLKALAQHYADYLADNDTLNIADLAYTASLHKTHYIHRLTLPVEDVADARQQLQAFVNGEQRVGMSSRKCLREADFKLAFVFSGQGPQWWAMGRQLLQKEPVFRDKIIECDRLMSHHAKWSLLAELTADEETSRIAETEISQPLLFALQVALAALWKSRGIEPDALVGHSVGEVAAAHISGALDLATAVKVIFYRGLCMSHATGIGGMMAAALTVEQATDLIKPYGDTVTIAAINSPSSVTLSGEPEKLKELAVRLDQQNIFNRMLDVQFAFHSSQMDPIRNELISALGQLPLNQINRPIYSTVTGNRVEKNEFNGEYWWHNVREKVRFAPAIQNMIKDGYNLFIEVGPHPVLTTSITECAETGKVTIIPSLRRKEDEIRNMLGNLGNLHTLGYPVNWKLIHKQGGHFIRLPGYPWQKQRYWHESETWVNRRAGKLAHPLLMIKADSANPCWNTVLDIPYYHYLADHKIRDNIVFPAAGYVEMAIGAACERFSNKPFVIDNIQIQKALYIAEKSTPVLQFSIDESDTSFVIRSSSSLQDGTWTTHCKGYIRNYSLPAPAIELERLKQTLTQYSSQEQIYQRFASTGLRFGPAFRGLIGLHIDQGVALGEVHLLETNQQHGSGYHFHPALLDACFQTLSGTLPEQFSDNLYLPVAIAQLRYYADAPQQVWVHAKCVHANSNSLAGDLRIYTPTGQLLIEVKGFRCQGIDSARDSTDKLNAFYQYHWWQSPTNEEQKYRKAVDFLPDISQLADPLYQESVAYAEQVGGHGQLEAMVAAFDELAVDYIVNAFVELGCPLTEGTQLSVDDLVVRHGVQESYRRLLQRLLEILAEQSLIALSTPDSGIIKQTLTAREMAPQWTQTLHAYPGAFSELTLIRNCGAHLARVLRGEQDPLQLLFPDGSSTNAEHFYTDSPSFRHYLCIVRKALELVVANLPYGRNLKILEIGAGTGGMTTSILNLFPKDRTEYYFTDISGAFFPAAEQRFKDYPFVRYQMLNIENNIEQQNYEPHSFDIVLASDVLHATQNLDTSLKNIKSLLAPSGLLLVLEVEKKAPWVDIIFGLTEGWWRFADTDLRPDYPLISQAKWKQILLDNGYSSPTFVSSHTDQIASPQIVFLTQAAEHRTAVTETLSDNTRNQPEGAKNWMIFADQGGIAKQLEQSLKARGCNVAQVHRGENFSRTAETEYVIAAGDKADMVRLIAERSGDSDVGIVYLWNTDAPRWSSGESEAIQQSEKLGCHTLLHLVQALTETGLKERLKRLVLVTTGAEALAIENDPVRFEQSALIGFARVVQQEHPEINCKTVDIDADSEATPLLLAELFTDDKENEVAYRHGERFAPRLRKQYPPCLTVDSSADQETPYFRLQAQPPGAINNLQLQQVSAPSLQGEQVEIKVMAASLNFRDVMKTLGLYPTDDGNDNFLGDECSGIISGIGPGVTDLRVGDPVIAVAPGSFASKVITLRRFVMPKPAHLNHQAAATIPIVFLTVYYALHHLARIQKGEKILIQAAAGGVGLAAVQIAKHAGAEVFVTAGNNEKRELLRNLGANHIMDSRSLTFADEIMSITAGRGVDIVLNSLAGDAIAKGIDSLAPYGRFLELGKMDIYQNNKIGLWAFRKNLAFYAIDLARMLSDKPELLSSIFREVHDLIENRHLFPLPHRVFPVTRIKDAFRYMAQGKHIGKVVVSLDERNIPVIPLAEKRPLNFNDQSSYMITGGFGGFGITLAHWIIQNGGKHLILVSRSGADSEQAQHALGELQATGATILPVKADVTDSRQVAALADQCATAMPPLKGIFHTAMVMDDGVIMQLDERRISNVMAPKVQGTWNLHHQFLDLKLDYFVLFSSISSLVGNPGQANYVAANFFMDMFAHYRRSQGLPAIAINWGALNEVGYLAKFEEVSKQLQNKGIIGFSPDEAMTAMERILLDDPIQISPALIEWQEWGKIYRNRGLPPRFSLLIDEQELQEKYSDQSGLIRTQIDEAAPEQCADIIAKYIREQVASVLRVPPEKLEFDQPLNELGLDSLMMVELGTRIENDLSISLPTGQLMQTPSLTGLAKVVLKVIGKDVGGQQTVSPAAPTAADTSQPKYPDILIPLKPATDAKLLFCFHPAGGMVNDYESLIERLPDDIGVMALQSCVLAGADREFANIDAMVDEYVKIIRQQQGTGPYYLLGYSFGGVICLAVAAKLQEQNQAVAFAGIIDSEINLRDKNSKAKLLQRIIPEMINFFFSQIAVLKNLPQQIQLQHKEEILQLMGTAVMDQNFEDLFIDWIKEKQYAIDARQLEIIRNYLVLFRNHGEIMEQYIPQTLSSVPVSVWMTHEGYHCTEAEKEAWHQLTDVGVNFEIIPGSHYTVMQPPHVDYLAEQIVKNMLTEDLAIA